VTAVNLLFLLFGVIALGSAVLVVSTRRIVHAALWLAVTLGALAACFLLLTAEFVAWVQILIYVGAVVVLLLFALMLTRAPIEPAQLTSKNAVFAGIVAAAVALVLVTTLVSGFSGQTIDLAHADIGSARTTGVAVFSRWVLAFELLSVLLLAALVSAIVLSRRASAEEPGQEAD
jgi:NADH-quinone oxidoreductase subunit J